MIYDCVFVIQCYKTFDLANVPQDKSRDWSTYLTEHFGHFGLQLVETLLKSKCLLALPSPLLLPFTLTPNQTEPVEFGQHI